MNDTLSPAAERRTFRLFEISILLKGFDAVLEVAAGLFALFTSSDLIVHFANYFTAAELGEDPNDFIANYLRHLASQYAAAGHTFAAIYLLSHGVIKLALVVGLLRGKLWAYPAALVVFSLFILYQIYLYIGDQSTAVLVLTLFDAIVLWFVWREYLIALERKRKHEPQQTVL